MRFARWKRSGSVCQTTQSMACLTAHDKCRCKEVADNATKDRNKRGDEDRGLVERQVVNGLSIPVSAYRGEIVKINTLRPSLAEPFLPSLPSSPSIPRRSAYAIRSLAGSSTSAGRRWTWINQIANAHVLRAFGVGSSLARGIARTWVKIKPSSSSTIGGNVST